VPWARAAALNALAPSFFRIPGGESVAGPPFGFFALVPRGEPPLLDSLLFHHHFSISTVPVVRRF
jgi:hypothetical protein